MSCQKDFIGINTLCEHDTGGSVGGRGRGGVG